MRNLQTRSTVSIDACQHHIRQLPGSTFCCLCIRAAPTPSDTIRRSSCNHFTYLGNLVVITQGPTASLLETWLAAFAAVPQTHWIPACLCRSRLAVLSFSFVHFSIFTLSKAFVSLNQFRNHGYCQYSPGNYNPICLGSFIRLTLSSGDFRSLLSL